MRSITASAHAQAAQLSGSLALELIREVQLKAEDAACNQTALINTLEEILPNFSEAYRKHYYELHGAYGGPLSTAETDKLLRPLHRTR